MIAEVAYLIPQPLRRPLRAMYTTGVALLKYGDPNFFTAVTIETSTACNRKCSYCPVAFYPRKQQLIDHDTFDLILRRLLEINWTGPLDLIHYNEPLLNPELDDLVRMVGKLLPKAFLCLTTNGDKLTVKRAGELIGLGVRQFNVTRHAPYSDKWDEQIADVRKTFDSHVHFLSSPGVEAWSNRGGLVETPGTPLTEKEQVCPNTALVIDMEANVILCCNDYFGNAKIGSLRNRTLLQVFYDKENVRERRELRQGIAKRELCKKCLGL